jgi:hypothetical protein
MNEALEKDRKRNYCSPQKTQTSITFFSKKKQNQGLTPERTALSRSFRAITSPSSVGSPPLKLKLSNNPFNPLAEEDDNEEEMFNKTPLQKPTASPTLRKTNPLFPLLKKNCYLGKPYKP